MKGSVVWVCLKRLTVRAWSGS